MENSLETRQDFFVVCSGEAEILPLDLKQRRRGEAWEMLVMFFGK
jgi:hypothetical protein